MVVGLALVAFAATQAFSNAGTAPTATPSPSVAASSSGSPVAATPSPTLEPSPSPTPSVDDLVRSFLEQLAFAIRTANRSAMLDRLDPAVIARYGLDACRAALATRPADPTFAVVVTAIHEPAAWSYDSDARSTAVPNAIAVDARVTANGVTAPEVLHLSVIDGQVHWFTDCGTPIN